MVFVRVKSESTMAALLTVLIAESVKSLKGLRLPRPFTGAIESMGFEAGMLPVGEEFMILCTSRNQALN